MRVLILGAGYVGMPLAEALTRGGHDAHTFRRTPGTSSFAGDISNAADLNKLPRDWDWVVNTVSSSKGGVDEYRRVYLQGTRNILEWLAGSKIQRYIHTSSTSVYGQTDGSWVDETSATEPISETSRILIETEKLLRDFPAVVLRVSGIYGPGRGHLFQQYLRNEATIAGDGSRYLNMIHRDDVVSAIIAVLERGAMGEIYNVVDDEPVTQLEFFQWLSRALSRPLPPHAPEGEGRKRGVTNKRVSNRKLRETLGWTPGYPNYRAGYAGKIRRS